MTLSVIIPTLDEGRGLAATLEAVRAAGVEDLIVVDGGSRDDTLRVARRSTDRIVHTPAPPGRARQMNAGARKATGDVFLFLHADTVLGPWAVPAIQTALMDERVVGGAFRLGIERIPGRPGLRLIAAAANLRTALTGLPYGDQGLFVRRAVFERIGGFPDLPLMEDVAFGRRLQQAGRVVILPMAATTSARRWEREGLVYTTFRNWALFSLYLLGVSPVRLARWYGMIR